MEWLQEANLLITPKDRVLYRTKEEEEEHDREDPTVKCL
jgi:hypothetical protein